MEFMNRLSTANTSQQILSDLVEGIQETYDLGILFVSQQNTHNIKEIVEGLQGSSKIHTLLGCTCAGIIGSRQELEYQPGVSLILGKLPGVKISPFSLNQPQLEGLESKKDWYQFLEIFPNENPVFITCSDPFLFDMNQFLDGLNGAFPQCPIIGGMASAAVKPNENILIFNDEFHDQGIIGVVLTGNLNVATVVSQGCRPMGENFIVTKAEGNIIYELAGKPFVQVLQNILDKAPAADKLLAQEAIFVGIALNEYKHNFKRGDFLIRGVMGIDQKIGAGAIGDYIKAGQTIQFHLRDAETATDDLNELLRLQQISSHKEKPKGALMFSCNGRGENLFREKNHDLRIIQEQIGPIPLAGFSAPVKSAR